MSLHSAPALSYRVLAEHARRATGRAVHETSPVEPLQSADGGGVRRVDPPLYPDAGFIVRHLVKYPES